MRYSGSMRLLSGSAAVALLGAVWSEQPVGARGAPEIMRVEEDWELNVNEPDVEGESPQFHTVMSPYAGLIGVYFQVSWNYRELPDFASGGLQLQVWNGEADFASREVGQDMLSRDAESVIWTSSLSTDSSHVTYAIQNGHSSSWGAFGGESMTVRTRRPVASLGSYDPAVSVTNSWITFGANRVQRLTLREIRYYDVDGNLLNRDTNERVIYACDESDD